MMEHLNSSQKNSHTVNLLAVVTAVIHSDDKYKFCELMFDKESCYCSFWFQL